MLDLAAGLTQVLADTTTTYLTLAGRIAADSTAWTYYHADALGSVRALSDASGQPISAHAYSPYGDPTTAASDDFGYTGEQVGAGGLVFLRARYYDPGAGVFLSHDPWSGDVMRPASLNGWSYVEGNPVNFTDPTGECRRSDGSHAFGIVPYFGDCYVINGQEIDTFSEVFQNYGQVLLRYWRISGSNGTSDDNEQLPPPRVEITPGPEPCPTPSTSPTGTPTPQPTGTPVMVDKFVHPLPVGAWTLGVFKFGVPYPESYGNWAGIPHPGDDYLAVSGTLIYAPSDGTVTWADPIDGYGNTVIVEHNINGEFVYSLSAHMDQVVVRVGQTVEQGVMLGTVGNTGSGSGGLSHLHFEVRKNTAVRVDVENNLRISRIIINYGDIRAADDRIAYLNVHFYNPTEFINNH